MKKVLIWLILACMPWMANAEEQTVEYACPYCSLRLPTGMRVISGDLLEALSEAALSDACVREDNCLMLALDEEKRRGMDIVISEEIPKEIPKPNIGEISEVTEIPIEDWTAGIYSIWLEENEYIQVYLYNDTEFLWITFCGMMMDECIAILKTVTKQGAC